MSKYEVKEVNPNDAYWHAFRISIDGDDSVLAAAVFRVADYGLALAREKAEAECAFLNAKAEKWEVVECGHSSVGRNFCVTIKAERDPAKDACRFYVRELGLDLARTEAARLCQLLNERDAKGAA